MKTDPEPTASIWMTTGEIPDRPALSHNMGTDVCVVGAGIAGLTTAYLLSREGKSVIVLDAGAVGGGETSRTTAHLANALDTHYSDLERLHGADGARLVAESHTAAIDRIEAIIAQERIACDFERLDGYLFAPPGESPDVLDQGTGGGAPRRTDPVSSRRTGADGPLRYGSRACDFPGRRSFTR